MAERSDGRRGGWLRRQDDRVWRSVSVVHSNSQGECPNALATTANQDCLHWTHPESFQYAGAVGTAPTVVLKLPSLDDTTRQSSIRCYEKEVGGGVRLRHNLHACNFLLTDSSWNAVSMAQMNFYSELAEKVSLKVPSIFGIWRDPAAPNEVSCELSPQSSERVVSHTCLLFDLQYFCIAMEDLSFKNNPLNQVIGISMPLQKLLLERMAKFNAEFYSSSVLSAKWLDTATPDHPYNPWFGDWVGQFLKDPSCWTPFLEAVKRYDEIQVLLQNHFPLTSSQAALVGGALRLFH